MAGTTNQAGAWPVVLDTDIGSDVDDLLALILLASEPRLDLVAVTTVYGDTILRARMARRVLRLMSRNDVPVHAGTDKPSSGRDVWWAGHEGQRVDGLGGEEISPIEGIDALIDAARRHPGELVVVAIGPLTNIAAAIDRDPTWAGGVRQLVVMGGEFARGVPEHNIRCDVVAARKVLTAEISSLYVGLDVTATVWFDETDLTTVTRSGSTLAQLVDGQVREWWGYLGRSKCNPHDPLAVLAMLEPECFSLQRSGWRVIDHGARLGALEAAPDAPTVEHAARVDIDAARNSITGRLSAAIAG